ncbi:MAG: DUF4019 domain-containing protein, partial [Deltaproteobacteria bacterium]
MNTTSELVVSRPPGAVEQEEWRESLQSVRKPFGEVISREVKTRSYLTSLPGAPDGEYVVS